MKLDEFESILRKTLDDRRLSRSERKAVAALLDDEGLDHRGLSTYRNAALGIAREAMRDGRDADVATWLYDVLNLLTPPPLAEVRAEALFSPGTACLERIIGLIRGTRQRLEVCVYTITDDRIAEVLLDAHRRNVDVRVLSDAVKTLDLGSDIRRLAAEGVAVALDTPDKYMHHKFAVFDRRLVVTGSYNWTRSAARANDENLIVSSDPRLVEAFTAEFGKLWERYADV
jgi:mitochondrial cardiolipin hydrolase